MWLDGLYMGSTIYAQWQHVFGKEHPEDNAQSWSDIALQFKTINRYTYDEGKQLNYHAWSATPEDENSFWSLQDGPFKGCSREFWARGMGWYFAALADVLEYMPQDHPDYADVLAIFRQVAAGLKRWQDPASGVWYQLLQYNGQMRADGKGDTINGQVYNVGTAPNYLEASASGIFTYAYLKGIVLACSTARCTCLWPRRLIRDCSRRSSANSLTVVWTLYRRVHRPVWGRPRTLRVPVQPTIIWWART